MKELFQLEKEWLASYPAHWNMSRLKDYTTTNTGITFTKADLSETGNAVLSYGQVHAKNNPRTEINHNLIKFIPDSFITDKLSAKVRRGDFIFADTSEDLEGCGNCIYINEEIDLYAGYHTILLRNNTLGYGKYFAYLFMADQWRSQIRKKVKSVKLFSITQGILNQTFIVLPPIAEQKAIVAYLDEKCGKIGREIELLELKADAYKRLRGSIINHAVTRGLNPNIPLKPSSSSVTDKIPFCWEERRIKDVFTEVSIKGFPEEPMLCATQSRGVIPQSMYENRVVVASSGLENMKLVEVGNFVISLRSFQGGIEYAYYRGIISAAYTILKLDAKHSKEYFRYFFKSPTLIKLMKKCVTGIREGQNINYTVLKYEKIPLPSYTEQQQIAAYLDEKCGKIDALIEKIGIKIERLKEFKRSLINEVVTGKRAINTLEA